MIDNLISDQMKEIWINLELYFESSEFSNFRDFFEFFVNFYGISKDFTELRILRN